MVGQLDGAGEIAVVLRVGDLAVTADGGAGELEVGPERTQGTKPGQGCPIPTTGGDVARLGPDARKRFEAGVAGMQDLIAAQFVRLGFDVDEAIAQAVVLMSELAGAVIMARAVKSTAAQKHVCQCAQTAILTRLRQSFPVFETETCPPAAAMAEEDAAEPVTSGA
ncbi:MAG: hypothetical protein WDN06_02610 [Asticcacaulis sp.]